MRWPPPRERALDLRTLRIGTLGSGGLVWSLNGWLHSVVVANADPTTAANVTFTDGRDGTGEPIGVVRVGVGMTVPLIFGMPGLPLAHGLFFTTDVPQLVGSVVIGQEVRA